MEVKKYSVVVLLNGDGSKVLLQTKARTAFAGMLNGVGGKVEENEKPWDGALREILEETGIHRKDIERFSWLGTLTQPKRCDERYPDKYPELWFFTGIVTDEGLAKKPQDAMEEIGWYMLDSNSVPFNTKKLAGDGELEYFIRKAVRMLFNGKAASYE